MYTPDPNDFGEILFRFRADDGIELSGAGAVTIDVLSVPDAPTGVADSYLALENTKLSVPAPSGVLANDSDGDGDPITAELVSGPLNGTLTEFKPGGRFDYLPDSGFVGEDTFTYRATDGALDSGPVSVTVTVQPGSTPSLRGGPERRAARKSTRRARGQ